MLTLCEITVNGKTLTAENEEQIRNVCLDHKASDKFTRDVLREYSSLVSCPLSGGRMLIGGKESFKMQKFREIYPDRFEYFMDTYFHELEAVYNPEVYRLSLHETFNHMIMAVARGEFHKDTPSFKNTCKVLKIKHTYKAIKAYLEGR